MIYFQGVSLLLSVSLSVIGISAVCAITYRIHRNMENGLKRLGNIASDMKNGTIESSLSGLAAHDEFSHMARSFHTLAADFRDSTEQERVLRLEAEEQAWINMQVSEMAILLQGSVKVEKASGIFMSKLASVLHASYGVLYVRRLDSFHFAAGYACDEADTQREPIAIGSGLVGQCAIDKEPLEVDHLPDGYIKVRSALGDAAPSHLLVVPILYENEAVAVMELASFREFSGKERQLIDIVSRNLGVLLNTLADIARIDALLRETQNQREELEVQTEELQAQTEELEAQTEELQAQTEELFKQSELLASSNEKLRVEVELTAHQKEEIEQQAEELQAQTEELQAQTEELKAQTEELAVSNENLRQQIELTERQKLEIKAQADEIYMAAQHKSEFLANVSHELRTPLNSLLILSQILAENKEGNLQTKQLEYVHTIFSAGKDLLQLIDEILDLAKLETGKMQSVVEPTDLRDVADHLFRNFELQAQKKEIKFDVRLDKSLPEFIMTDGHRLRQVLRNLLSNALKFTQRGTVSLDILKGGASAGLRVSAGVDETVFVVSDTGIGIPSSKFDAIFEAFQQADGTTSRKYGGTGLGLTISRELAGLLGGRIELESVEGQGSTFYLILPAILADAVLQPAADTVVSIAAAAEHTEKDKSSFRESFVPDISISNPKLLQFSEMEDDRYQLQPDDTVLLIIEDDQDFASILLELARKRGFKAIVAFQGDQGLALAHAYKPDAILLDTDLPVLDGWAIITRLKSRPELRHIPVYVISTEETNPLTLSIGALSFWKKPSDHEELEAAFLQIETYIRRKTKSLLIVEDNPDLRKSLVAFIAHPDVHITAVATGREALEQLTLQHFDCMVLDLGLSDISGFDLLEQVKTNRKLQTLPVIIYTGKELSKQDEQRLKHYAESIVIKDVRSLERLYDETALYLHRKTSDLPPDKQRLIEKLHNPEAAFEGRRILLVDDDMRNIFALSSVLEGYNMDIRFAQNGREALGLLQQEKDIELVFMDIMMPEMDGYETMKAIRNMPEYENLIIIALTARAMEEDRINCLQAGASDYIPKPINTTQLVTMLKAWLIK
ncbi:response regulator [Paenibacillus abyssi]|uniref:Circadian input-output histidine kinase CikA n=1 Tax=Paenibacillus abyssi TaxID=1340531 RepID=A0A917G4W6_9BACL|nr:response regulator [Paenibacillus abyssi]GGG23024.1 histidine kinase [Paenibacillus abyssi]